MTSTPISITPPAASLEFTHLVRRDFLTAICTAGTVALDRVGILTKSYFDLLDNTTKQGVYLHIDGLLRISVETTDNEVAHVEIYDPATTTPVTYTAPTTDNLGAAVLQLSEFTHPAADSFEVPHLPHDEWENDILGDVSNEGRFMVNTFQAITNASFTTAGETTATLWMMQDDSQAVLLHPNDTCYTVYKFDQAPDFSPNLECDGGRTGTLQQLHPLWARGFSAFNNDRW